MKDFPRTIEGLTRSEMEGGLAVHDAANDRVHFLNYTGTVILELCDGQHSVSEIVDAVQAAYGLPAPPEDEVRHLLADAVNVGIVAWTGPGEPGE